MASKRARRRLAAILAADLVGYSRLMRDDEDGTLAALKRRLSEVIEPAIADHGGRIVKTTGDGVLAEFASAVDAVSCAVAIQEGMDEANAGARRGRELLLRIGVNVGDIIVDGDDIYGDGVNVAARLEGLAEPGTVCVSGTVYDQVRGKLSLGFADLGPRRVKNIAEPVRAYQVFADPDDAAEFSGQGRRGRVPRSAFALILMALVAAALFWLWPRGGTPPVPPPETPEITEPAQPLPDRPSLALMPFAAEPGTEVDGWFADGVTTDIIGALSRLSGLFVIAPHSSLAYRDAGMSPKDVARDLGVAHVVEGSIGRTAGRVAITARLLDAATGNAVATVSRDGDPAAIATIEAAVARELAAALAVQPSQAEAAILDRVAPRDSTAYDLYLRGRALLAARDVPTDRILDARNLFREAMALDPAFAGGYAGLAETHVRAVSQGMSEAPGDDIARAVDFATTAVAIDEAFTPARLALIRAHLSAGRLEEAVTVGRRTVELDPGNAEAHGQLGLALTFAGQHEQAIAEIRRAIRLDPNRVDGPYRNMLGVAAFASGRYAEAVDAWEANVALGGPIGSIPAFWVVAYEKMGEPAKAAAARERLLAETPGFRIATYDLLRPFNPADRGRIASLMLQAGLPE